MFIKLCLNLFVLYLGMNNKYKIAVMKRSLLLMNSFANSSFFELINRFIAILVGKETQLLIMQYKYQLND